MPPIRPPKSAGSGDVDLREYFGEHGAVVALAAGDDHRQRTSAPIHGLTDRGRQPTTRATDTIPSRFTFVPGQILVIRSPLCPAPGGSCSPRADADARSSRPPTPPSRSSPPRPPRPGSGSAPDPGCRHPRSGGVASRPPATARTTHAGDPIPAWWSRSPPETRRPRSWRTVSPSPPAISTLLVNDEKTVRRPPR